jgi:hypothetical protein
MAPAGGSGAGGEDLRVEVKGSRPFIGEREVKRGSKPPTRESPGHQVAGTGPASAGVRAQGEASDGPVDAMRRPGDECGHDTRREWALMRLGARVLGTTRAQTPRLAAPRSPARTGAPGVSPSRRRGATIVDPTGPV